MNKMIKELRLAHGLNQVQFGEKLSVSKQTVSNWENGNIQPSIDMLVKIADYFNVSTDYILERSSKKLIDAEGLTDIEFAHISMLVSDLKSKK